MNDVMKMCKPIPTDELPTAREWTDAEWVCNQWWLANEHNEELARRVTKLEAENVSLRMRIAEWEQRALSYAEILNTRNTK